MTIMTHQAPLPLSTPLVEREPRCWTFSHGSTIGLHWIEAIKRLLKPIKTPGLEEGHLHNHSMTLCLEVGCGSTPVPSCPGRWVVWVSISAECLFKPIASLRPAENAQKMPLWRPNWDHLARKRQRTQRFWLSQGSECPHTFAQEEEELSSFFIFFQWRVPNVKYHMLIIDSLIFALQWQSQFGLCLAA